MLPQTWSYLDFLDHVLRAETAQRQDRSRLEKREEIDTVFVLAVRNQREAGYAER